MNRSPHLTILLMNESLGKYVWVAPLPTRPSKRKKNAKKVIQNIVQRNLLNRYKWPMKGGF